MNEKANLSVRDAIEASGITYREVGEMMGYKKSNFSKLLSKEQPIELQNKMIYFIRTLMKANGMSL